MRDPRSGLVKISLSGFISGCLHGNILAAQEGAFKISIPSEEEMKKDIRVLQFGIGVIGRGVTKVLAQKRSMKIVGAIDVTNEGKDLGEVAGVGRKLGVKISNDLNKVVKQWKPQVAIHTTSSSLKKVYPAARRYPSP